jgi:hypothetical protein
LRLAAALSRGAPTRRTLLNITFSHGNNWKNMTNFQVWEQHNLARFAREANEKLLAQQKEIEQLRDDLRIAIEAYRKLIKGTL